MCVWDLGHLRRVCVECRACVWNVKCLCERWGMCVGCEACVCFVGRVRDVMHVCVLWDMRHVCGM